MTGTRTSAHVRLSNMPPTSTPPTRGCCWPWPRIPARASWRCRSGSAWPATPFRPGSPGWRAPACSPRFDRRVRPEALGYRLGAYMTVQVVQRGLADVSDALAAHPRGARGDRAVGRRRPAGARSWPATPTTSGGSPSRCWPSPACSAPTPRWRCAASSSTGRPAARARRRGGRPSGTGTAGAGRRVAGVRHATVRRPFYLRRAQAPGGASRTRRCPAAAMLAWSGARGGAAARRRSGPSGGVADGSSPGARPAGRTARAAAVGVAVSRATCPGTATSVRHPAVPADHFARRVADWAVTFALHRADVKSRGVVVTATGGPGSSGIAVADDYTAPCRRRSPTTTTWSSSTSAGSAAPGPSGATGPADRPRSDRLLREPGGAERLAPAQTFVEDCLGEAGVRRPTPAAYATAQAVGGPRGLPQWLHADQLILYGESYGTSTSRPTPRRTPTTWRNWCSTASWTSDRRSRSRESARAYSTCWRHAHRLRHATAACAAAVPRARWPPTTRLRPRCAPHRAGTPIPLPTAAAAPPSPDPRRPAGRRGRLGQLLARRARSSGPSTRRLRATTSPWPGSRPPDGGADPDTGDERRTDDGFSEGRTTRSSAQDSRSAPPPATGRAQLDGWLAAAGAGRHRRGAAADGFYDRSAVPALARREDRRARPAVSTDPPYPELLLTADTDPNTPTVDAQRISPAPATPRSCSSPAGRTWSTAAASRCVDDVVTGLVTTGRLPSSPVTVCTGPSKTRV